MIIQSIHTPVLDTPYTDRNASTLPTLQGFENELRAVTSALGTN